MKKIILSLLLLTSCRGTLEEISRIGTVPAFSRPEPPVAWADNVKETAPRQANSLWQPGARGFFRDTKARGIGDILRVTITINDQAKLNNQTQTQRQSNENMNLSGLFGAQTQLHKFIPMPANAPLVGTTGSNNNQGTGNINRQETIKTEIAAMVKQVLPNGNLAISGSQEIRINYELRELSISGIIRPEDIGPNNTVSYDQIAEARISYGGRGNLSTIQKPRWGSELFEKILPW